MEDRVNVAVAPKWIGICLSQAHTLLKDNFLCELEKEADSAAKDIRSAMDNTEPAGSAPGAFETTTETDGEEPAVSDTKTQSQEEN